jgi:aldose 1-epimerase
MAQNYTITSQTRDGVEILTLCEAETASAAIVPAWGNNCFQFVHGHLPVLEPVAFETFRQRPTSYGLPLLFPFPNRIRGGTFTFRGRQYAVNPAPHGFVRDKPWHVCGLGASDQQGAWLTSRLDAAQYPEQILQQFPFPFCLEATYRLKDGVLSLEATVQNTGDQDLPLGFGLHPYLYRPRQGTLHVPAQTRWELRKNLPTGARRPAEGEYDLRRPRDVIPLELDDIFTDLIADADGLVRCVLRDHQHGTQTTIAFDATQFPHVVVYTPPAPRQAICIEPYTCPTDGFNLYQQGIVESNLIVLEPGMTRTLTVSISRTSCCGIAEAPGQGAPAC